VSATTTDAGAPTTVGQVLAMGAFIATVSGVPTVAPRWDLAVLVIGAALVALLLVLQRWPERPGPGLDLLRWTPGPSFTRWSTAAGLAVLALAALAAATATLPPAAPTVGVLWMVWLASAAIAHHRATRTPTA